jgi:hypothetical protein
VYSLDRLVSTCVGRPFVSLVLRLRYTKFSVDAMVPVQRRQYRGNMLNAAILHRDPSR